MDKIPVVIRRWRDSKKLIVMFVTLPYQGDPTKCPAVDARNAPFWVKPITASRQTTEITKDESESILATFDAELFRALGLPRTTRLEFWKRDRVAETTALRLHASQHP